MNFETADEIELAVAESFGYRQHVIVPNVSWGLFLDYEADLLILTRSRYLWEVEIKVSRADLLRDGKKRHQHDSKFVRQLWFAMPEKMASCIADVPERAGVLIVDSRGFVRTSREASTNRLAAKLSDEQCFQLARLGTMRIWSLKRKCIEMINVH